MVVVVEIDDGSYYLFILCVSNEYISAGSVSVFEVGISFRFFKVFFKSRFDFRFQFFKISRYRFGFKIILVFDNAVNY